MVVAMMLTCPVAADPLDTVDSILRDVRAPIGMAANLCAFATVIQQDFGNDDPKQVCNIRRVSGKISPIQSKADIARGDMRQLDVLLRQLGLRK